MSIYKSTNTLLENLESYWAFDGNVNDYWQGNNDWNNNGATLSSGNGLYGDAYLLDGTDDYLQQTLNLSQDSFTINMWVKLNSLSGQQRIWLTSLDINTNQTSEVSVDLLFNDGQIRFAVANNSTNWLLYTDNNILPLNEWSMITFSWDKSDGTMKMWIDYSNYYTRSSNTTINNLSYTRIGKFNATLQFFNGYIDEISYWKRVLTDTEVEKLYNNGNGLKLSYLSYVPKFWREDDTYTPKKIGYGLLNELESYWSLNGNATDNHRNNNGNINGVTNANGIIDGCYLYDGVDDYIDNVSGDQNFGQTDVTLSLWIKTNSSNSSFIFGGWNSTDNSNPKPNIQFTYNILSGGKINLYSNTSGVRINSNTSVNDNEWHHVIFRFSGTTGSIYIDGEFESSGNMGTITWDGWHFAIGGSGLLGGGSSKYAGLMDEVCVWLRALTESEIKVLYNNGSGLPYENFRY